MLHLELMLNAKAAITKVYSDTFVDLQTIKDSMEELLEIIETNIETIIDDMETGEED